MLVLTVLLLGGAGIGFAVGLTLDTFLRGDGADPEDDRLSAAKHRLYDSAFD